MAIGCVLAVLAVVFVGLGPLWVARWHFLHRIPRAAVLLWQAGTVAALVSIIGAGALFALDLVHGPVGGTLPGTIVAAAVIVFATNVVCRLVWALIWVARSTGARRARHRRLVDLLADIGTDPTIPGLRVLAEESPMAYCLPALRGPRVVVSRGALERLDPDALSAVLLHERAHVRARHDVVLDTFTAVHRAFPFLVRSDVPLREARLLVELLADDAARRSVGAAPLARALITMVDARPPRDALGIIDGVDAVSQRLQRLATDHRPERLLAAGAYALTVALVAGPVALLTVGALG